MAKAVAIPMEVDYFVIRDFRHIGPAAEVRTDEKGWIELPAGATARYMPVPGDYLVQQADGYMYLNPKAVFERKYRPVVEPAAGLTPAEPGPKAPGPTSSAPDNTGSGASSASDPAPNVPEDKAASA